jgi:hypothetical protein
VKRTPSPASAPATNAAAGANTNWSRHLEGWQPGLVAIAVAGLGLLLALPQSVPPTELPLPLVPPASLESARTREQARAAHLVRRTSESGAGAAYDLRVAGDLLRQIGRADHDKDREQVGVLRDKLAGTLATIRRTPALGDEALVELRAFQEQAFLRELSRWETTGEASAELVEIAGDFLPLAERSGWVRPPHRLILDDAVRGALFRKRFGELTSLRDGAFVLTVDEQRHLLGFFLLHPPPGGAGPPIADAELRNRATAQWLLRKVDELASIDAAYPVAFARGVLLFQMGDPASSALAFRAHLARHPDGPFTLRARNHLRAAEARLDVAH